VTTEAMPDTDAWGIAGKVATEDSPYRLSKSCVRMRDGYRASVRTPADANIAR